MSSDNSIRLTKSDLVLCVSADGWSLHAPGSNDEEIASGDAPCIISGEGEEPSDRDYAYALEYVRVMRLEELARSQGGRP